MVVPVLRSINGTPPSHIRICLSFPEYNDRGPMSWKPQYRQAGSSKAGHPFIVMMFTYLGFMFYDV